MSSLQCAGSHHFFVGGSGDRGARARTRYELGLLLCSVADTTISGGGVGFQSAGVEALMVKFELVPFPLSVSSPSCQD